MLCTVQRFRGKQFWPHSEYQDFCNATEINEPMTDEKPSLSFLPWKFQEKSLVRLQCILETRGQNNKN